MRKLIALLAAMFLILSSVGLAVAQSDGFTWNPDGEVENKTAQQTYQRLHSQDGGTINPEEKNQEHVYGVNIENNHLYWSAYTHSASGSNEYYIDMYVRDLEAGENVNTGLSRQATLGTQEINPTPAQAIIDSDSGDAQIFGENKYFIWHSLYGEFGMVEDGSGTAEVYSTKHQSGTTYPSVVLDDGDVNQINGMHKVDVNGSEKVIITTDAATFSWDTETETATQIVGHSLYQAYTRGTEMGNSSYLLWHTNTTTQYTASEQYGMGQYYNYTNGNWSYIYANHLASNEDYVAFNHQDGTTPEKWGNQTLIFNKTAYEDMLDGSSGEYEYEQEALDKAAHTVPFPDNVTAFEDGFYAGNHWFFADAETRKIYVYNDELSDLEAVINDPWETWDGFQTGFDATVVDGNVTYATFDNNAMTVYDSQIQVETTPSGCMAYLQPSDLTKLSEAPNVCWVPIFTGIWILATSFQWLLLAVLIAMPVAKMTQSDIATMATIDGVLLIGMILGTLSPGFVAIGILTTVLLAAYGRSGANITINNGGNGGI